MQQLQYAVGTSNTDAAATWGLAAAAAHGRQLHGDWQQWQQRCTTTVAVGAGCIDSGRSSGSSGSGGRNGGCSSCSSIYKEEKKKQGQQLQEGDRQQDGWSRMWALPRCGTHHTT